MPRMVSEARVGTHRPLVAPSSVDAITTRAIDSAAPSVSHTKTNAPSCPNAAASTNGRGPLRSASRLVRNATEPLTSDTGMVAMPARAALQCHWLTVCCTRAQ